MASFLFLSEAQLSCAGCQGQGLHVPQQNLSTQYLGQCKQGLVDKALAYMPSPSGSSMTCPSMKGQMCSAQHSLRVGLP